jgi:hypothetical protein
VVVPSYPDPVPPEVLTEDWAMDNPVINNAITDSIIVL